MLIITLRVHSVKLLARQHLALCGLTFELRGQQRWGARPGLAKMYPVPPDRAWWPAAGAPFERGVRPHSPHVRLPGLLMLGLEPHTVSRQGQQRSDHRCGEGQTEWTHERPTCG